LGGFERLNIQIDNFTLIIIQNFNFRHIELLRSLFQKQLFSKQLIYTKQLNMIFFSKTTYLSKNSLLRLIFKKQLIQISLFIHNSLLRSRFQKELIQNSLFMQNNLLGPIFQK